MCSSFRLLVLLGVVVFFFKQKTAYEMRISDWSSDVCSSDLDSVAAMHADRERRHDDAVPVVLGDVLGLDDELAGLAPLGQACLHRALRSLVPAIAGPHGLQITEPAHIALPAGSDAVSQPVFLALDRLAELMQIGRAHV